MRKPIVVLSLAAILATGLGGCVSILPKTKPSQLYRFGAETSSQNAPSSQGEPIGVVLGQIEFPRASTSDGILTVTGDKTAYIDGARWVAPARVLFTEAVQGAFLAKSQKVQLVNVGEAGPAAAILSIRVTAFEARYQGDGPPTIAISLVARMTGSDGEFLDERPFSVTEQAQANSISMIVKAFDQGADEILGTLITWSDSQAAKAQAKVTSSPASPAASPTGTATISTTSSTSTVQSTTTAPR